MAVTKPVCWTTEFAFFQTLDRPSSIAKWSWILMDSFQVQKASETFVVVCSRRQFLQLYVAIANFTSGSCGWRLRNVPKSVMHVQCCCFAYKNNCSYDVIVAVVLGMIAKLPSVSLLDRCFDDDLLYRSVPFASKQLCWISCLGEVHVSFPIKQ